jgi:hypothetical protein
MQLKNAEKQAENRKSRTDGWLFRPAFPCKRWPHECHDQLVVRRREMQQTARAGLWFRGSTVQTEVFAAERFLIDLLPEHVFVVATIDERVDFAVGIAVEEAAAFHSRTKEHVRRFRE